ncbi:hypothetical protein [uncultured Treponema sp.]|uniref:hypothetical protein n=1 Tax=uncultured Treponema sp. TaxID=162155 RepID=UPI0025F59677|nr:hypothetical protein [uncultured Treponema sp.]
MKRYLFTLICAASIIPFISCGSTPTVEPEPPKAEEPAPVVEEPTPEPEPEPQPPAEDFSQANEALLAQADSARAKAIEAGAEKYFRDVLSADDKFYESVKAEIKANPTADHSEKIKEVIVRYEALATASLAKEMKLKADEFGLADADAEKALSDFEASENGNGMRENADKALSAYSALLLKKLGEMAKTERSAALEAKKNADSVKAGVAKKTEYAEASATFKKADSSFASKDLEGAYKGYRSAKNAFTKLYELIAEKRAAAQAAIERAKKRVAEAENYTKEADTIAPLENEVAGIEKEDAVLLESDNFANPEDAVIDVESSDEAKAAAAIDKAINDAADAIQGDVK